MTQNNKAEIEELYELVASINSAAECRELFEDLCTYKEINSMAQRLRAAKLLTEGVTYEQIIEMTGISSATLSRVNKCVKYGNGYKRHFKKQPI